MKSWSWILITALVLLFVLLIVLRGRSPFGSNNSSFAVDWTEDIDHIKINDKNSSLVLDKVDDEWIVNKSSLARSSAIEFILKTIEKIEIKSPVSSELFDELVVNRNLEPLEVSIYGGRKSRTYFIYKTNDSTHGNIMRRSLSSKPFFVSLPGYDFDPGSHFVSDKKFWIPYHIFNIQPDAIKFIVIAFQDPEMGRLDLEIDSGNIEVRLNDILLTDAKQEKIRRYISYFTFVPFEDWAYELDQVLRSNLLASEPEILIEIGLVDDNKVVAQFWNIYIETSEGIVPDTDRLYGTINGGDDIFIVKYFDLDPLIKTGDYFISD